MTYYAYFKADGTPLSVANHETRYPEPDVVMCEIPDFTNGNAIYLDISDPENPAVRGKEPFALEIAYNRVSNIPAGTRITIDEGEFMIDDGSAEFDADMREVKVVWLDHPHFLATHIEVQTGPEDV